ncbi:MAG: T9SS type A sorting domain-containing protein [candidate division WOR-3 bacterium]
MKKFLVLFLAFVLLVLPALAVTVDFEDREIDSENIRPFAKYRLWKDRAIPAPKVIGSEQGLPVRHGTRGLLLPLVDTSGLLTTTSRWLLIAKDSARGGGPTQNAFDQEICNSLQFGDTLWYYLYVPSSAVQKVDSIVIFERDSDWTHDLYTIYHIQDLTPDAWNELISTVSETNYKGEALQLRFIQTDFEIYSDSSYLNPACSLYFDYFSTDGPYGILIKDKNGIKLEALINKIKISSEKSALAMVSVYGVDGSKKMDLPIMIPNEVELTDLPAGVYFVRVVSGPGSAQITKLLVVK